jgi:hypothetical protein
MKTRIGLSLLLAVFPPLPLRSRMFRILGFGLCSAVALAFSACATQPRPEAYDPPGFWSGLLHGFLIAFSFIGSLFTDWRIYAFPNSGGWYDFGYLIGAGLFLGGGGASSRTGYDESDESEG